MDYAGRQEKLRAALHEAAVDGLIVASAANVRYLSGFPGEGLLFVGAEVKLSTDGRFREEASVACVDDVVMHERGHWHGMAEILRDAGARRVGFEAERTTVASLEDIKKRLEGVELVPLRKTVEKLRRVKEPEEIDLIRQAARITDEALAAYMQSGPPQQSEKLAAWEIIRLMLERGADKASFDPIVACGEAAAEPHHEPTNRVIAGPAMLKLDIGARYRAYCADLTRTYYLGNPDDQFRKIYRIVYDAQQRALEKLRPGVACTDVDAAARQVIEEAGLGDKFSHSLGHGVGLEIHEGPALSKVSEDILEENMVVTVEPGIYISGWGGVRLEDLVVVTPDGPELLSRAYKPAPDEL